MANKATEAVAWTGLAIAFVYVLVVGKELLIPLAVAGLVFFLLNAFSRTLMRVTPGGARLPRWVWSLAALALVLAALGGTFDLLAESLSGVSRAAPKYQENILRLRTRRRRGLRRRCSRRIRDSEDSRRTSGPPQFLAVSTFLTGQRAGGRSHIDYLNSG